MSTTGLKQFDHALHVANGWLNEIMKTVPVDRHGAWHILGAVLHTLRERLTLEQTAHLGDQLPLIIRGLFFDQWNPTSKSPKMRTRTDFLTRVRRRMKMKEINVADATETVLGVLMRHPKGEVQKILRTLPPAIRELAPPQALYAKAGKGASSGGEESPFAWE